MGIFQVLFFSIEVYLFFPTKVSPNEASCFSHAGVSDSQDDIPLNYRSSMFDNQKRHGSKFQSRAF